jgi:hypothetical protein
MSATPARNDASWFRLRGTSPLVAVVVSVALVAGGGIATAALFQDEPDIRPHVPVSNEVRALLGSGPFAFLPATLDQFNPSPQPSGTGITPSSPAPPIGDSGMESVAIAGGVELRLPDPWRVLARTPSAAYLGDGRGGWFGVRVLEFERTTPAADLIGEALDELVPAEAYSQRRTSGTESLVPFGDLVSWAAVGYSAVRTDAQGAESVAGNIFAFVRADGLAMILGTEVSPVGDWEDRIGDWLDLFGYAARSFGRGPLG